MELLLMIDAARGASAAQITAVMPHYAYARSDKKDASRISLGGRLVADMIWTAGAHRVLTMALHAPQVHGFFSMPVDHLTAIGVLADHFRDGDLDRLRRRQPGPRQRQGRDPVRPAAGPARRRRLEAAHLRRRGRHRLDRRRRRRPSGHHPRRRDRDWRLDARADRAPQGRRRHRGRGRLHPRPLRRQGGRAAARPPVRSPRSSPPTPSRRRMAGPSCRSARCRRCSPRRSAASTTGVPSRSLFEGVDPTHAPPQARLPFDPLT